MDPLCENCENIFRAAYAMAAKRRAKGTWYWPKDPVTGCFVGGLDGWTRTATDGTCQLCALLYDELNSETLKKMTAEGGFLSWSVYWDLSRIQCKLIMPSKSKHIFWPCVSLWLHEMSSARAQQLRTARDNLHRSTFNVDVLQRLRVWIRECTSSHGHKSTVENEGAMRPKRLLDVDPNNTGLPEPRTEAEMAGYSCEAMPQVLLQSTEEWTDEAKPFPAYLTLSHCWGQSVVLQLTKELLRQYSNENIPPSHLAREGAKTFRDAIQITRCLGFRYLWIDSLCIQQDDDVERASEVVRMRGIYANAQANLAAAGGGTMFTKRMNGMIFDREEDTLERMKPCWWSNGRSLQTDTNNTDRNDYMITYNTDDMAILRFTPLNSRAWVFQERYLSPRVVTFCTNHVYWACSHEICAEWDTFKPWLIQSLSTLPIKKQMHFVKRTFSSPGKIFSQTDEWHHIYWNLVKQYSQCKLTFASDRLPAFAGVAQDIAARAHFREDDYIAGFWRHELPRCLLWYTSAGTTWLPIMDTTTRHDDRYIAPSWSWASNKNNFALTGWPKDGSVGKDLIQDLVQVVDVSIEPRGTGADNMFGPLEGAVLRLRGYIYKPTRTKIGQNIALLFQDSNGFHSENVHGFYSEMDNVQSFSSRHARNAPGINIEWDTYRPIGNASELSSSQAEAVALEAEARTEGRFKLVSTPPPETIHLLPICHLSEYGATGSIVGIILEPAEAPCQYRRIGYFSAADPHGTTFDKDLSDCLWYGGEHKVVELV